MWEKWEKREEIMKEVNDGKLKTSKSLYFFCILKIVKKLYKLKEFKVLVTVGCKTSSGSISPKLTHIL